MCDITRSQSDAVKRKMVADERSELEKKPLATLGATSSDQMENTHYIHDKKVCVCVCVDACQALYIVRVQVKCCLPIHWAVFRRHFSAGDSFLVSIFLFFFFFSLSQRILSM